MRSDPCATSLTTQRRRPQTLRAAALCIFTIVLAAACGGGGTSDNGVRTTAVKVAGDSLSDGGTFGAKATVQGTSLLQTRLWVDVVTDAVGLPPLCPHYIDAGFGPVPNTALASVCTNHAVGGGVVNVPGGNTLDDTPFAVPRQMEDIRKQAAYAPEDLLLVDGGGNDAALLFTLYLDTLEPPADRTPMLAMLADLLGTAQLQAATVGGDAGLVNAGTQYMTALADRMADAIRDQALAFGARRVVVLNMPDVARTPRFTGALARLVTLEGGDSAALARASARAAVAKTWASAYNGRLAQRAQAQPEATNVAIVDFHALLNGWINNPSAAGFTNVTQPVCPAVSTDNRGLPSYDLRTCTEAALTANPPAGTSADGWRSYLFADHFHGTPRMNDLLAQEALRVMRTKAWQ